MKKLIFIIDQAKEGGYNARAETASIFTQAETIEELKLNIADAIECHFDNDVLPAFTLKFV